MPDFPLPAHQLHSLFKTGETTPEEVTLAALERISSLEPSLNGLITLNDQDAISQSRMASQRFKGHGQPPTQLTGVPIVLKDNISTKGLKTTAGSRILADYVPPYDATVAGALRSAGAVVLGKANMDEFAMGSSTENSSFEPSRNPWDTERSPGGSSGGSAVAVASGECSIAFGSDTGGSIRQPAALCGVTGMKPTYGLVSRYGLIAFSSSLDQIGPIGQDAMDCAIALDTIWGVDEKDATSIPKPDLFRGDGKGSFNSLGEYLESFGEDGLRGLKVGVPSEYLGSGIDAGVRSVFEAELNLFERLGGHIEETSLPMTEHSLAVYYIVAPSEASTNLSRYDGVKYGLRIEEGVLARQMTESTRGAGFGEEVKRRILLGTYALSAGYYDAWYKKARQVATLIREDFDRVFSKFDILATPTSPTVAFKLGERTGNPLAMYQSDICTVPVNIAELPAISVPCGFSDGLPVGLQIIAPKLQDSLVLRAAWAYQLATNWHKHHPDVDRLITK